MFTNVTQQKQEKLRHLKNIQMFTCNYIAFAFILQTSDDDFQSKNRNGKLIKSQTSFDR